jgi:hypothetical protein
LGVGSRLHRRGNRGDTTRQENRAARCWTRGRDANSRRRRLGSPRTRLVRIFFNIVFFVSISKTSIHLQVISKVVHPRIRRTREVVIASTGCDYFAVDWTCPSPACSRGWPTERKISHPPGAISRCRHFSGYAHPADDPEKRFRQRAPDDSLFHNF